MAEAVLSGSILAVGYPAFPSSGPRNNHLNIGTSQKPGCGGDVSRQDAVADQRAADNFIVDFKRLNHLDGKTEFSSLAFRKASLPCLACPKTNNFRDKIQSRNALLRQVLEYG